MVRLFLLVWLMLCALGASASVSAEEITLYVEDGYAPFSMANGKGISNDIVERAYQEVGVDVRFEVLPFARVVKWLLDGKGLGGFNAAKTEGTKNQFLFSKEPIYHVKNYLYYRVDKPLKISSLSDLNDPQLDVGEVNGYMYSQQFLNLKFRRHKAKSDDHILRMLTMGRVDAVYVSEKSVEYFVQQNHLYRVKFARLENIIQDDIPLYVIFNKHHPKGAYYRDLLDQGIRKLKANDLYEILAEL